MCAGLSSTRSVIQDGVRVCPFVGIPSVTLSHTRTLLTPPLYACHSSPESPFSLSPLYFFLCSLLLLLLLLLLLTLDFWSICANLPPMTTTMVVVMVVIFICTHNTPPRAQR